MPTSAYMTSVAAKVAAELSRELQLPNESDQLSRVAAAIRRACETVVGEAGERIVGLERQLHERQHIIEQLQELVDSLIEKPK